MANHGGPGGDPFFMDEDAELNALNDPMVEPLPDIEPIRNPGGMHVDESGNTVVSPASGRGVDAPLVTAAAQNPACANLHVFVYEDGTPVSLGRIDPKAGETEFIRKFINAMPVDMDDKRRFGLRPCDINGRPLGQEHTHIIGGSHSALLQIRRRAASGGGGASLPLSALGLDPISAKLLMRTLDADNERSRRLEDISREEMMRVRERDAELAKERVDLAMAATTAQTAMTERMMSDEARRAERAAAAEHERNRIAQEQMGQFFTTQVSMTKESSQATVQLLVQQREQDQKRWEHEREIERQRWEQRMTEEAERRKAERAEMEERRKAERDELLARQREAEDIRRRDEEERRRRWEDEKEERRRRWEEEKEEAKRKHEREMEELKAARARIEREAEERARAQREHDQALAALRLEEIKLRAGGGGGGLEDSLTKAATLAKLFGVDLGQVARRVLVGDSKDDDEGGGGGSDNAWVGEALGAGIRVFGEVLKERARNPAPQMMAPPMYPMLPGPGIPPLTPGVPQAQGAPVQQGAQGGGAQAQGAPAAPEAPSGPSIDLPLETQKAARTALRQLVANIRGEPDREKWQTLIMAAIASEPAIWHYLAKTSIRFAAEEAGASKDLTDEIIQRVNASGLVDNSIPRE